MNEPELTIVIPTYNEGDIIVASLKRLSTTLGDLCKQTEVIIADDGTDDLPAVVEQCKNSLGFMAVKVMRNSPALGKGRSIVKAFNASRGAITGFIDVDFSVDPKFIHDAVREIKKGNDSCIGSRVGDRFKSDRSLMTSILATTFRWFYRHLLFGKDRNFTDTQCGFKFFKLEVAWELWKDLVAPDGLADLEVLVKAVKLGYKISELKVPRINDRRGKRRLSRIFVHETVALGRIFCKYRLGWNIKGNPLGV